ncbi:MAG: SUMF1/EgtB/PvdO family nonheme iron enzyme [Planctomycetota bacterium]|nr:SUMF1/EgtB/PvdO family nonheme iron enzyme [Planctomycetota bacterium]
MPRLRSLQPCIPADDHGCTRRSRGTHIIKVDGPLVGRFWQIGLGPLGPGGAEPNSQRVLRGGSWNNNTDNCRAANRNNNTPDNRNNNYGFRVVVSVSAPALSIRRLALSSGIDRLTGLASVTMKVLALLLSRRASSFRSVPAGRICVVGPGESGSLFGERLARLQQSMAEANAARTEGHPGFLRFG